MSFLSVYIPSFPLSHTKTNSADTVSKQYASKTTSPIPNNSEWSHTNLLACLCVVNAHPPTPLPFNNEFCHCLVTTNKGIEYYAGETVTCLPPLSGQVNLWSSQVEWDQKERKGEKENQGGRMREEHPKQTWSAHKWPCTYDGSYLVCPPSPCPVLVYDY